MIRPSSIAVALAMASAPVAAQHLSYGQLHGGAIDLSSPLGDTDARIFGGRAEFELDAFTLSADVSRVSTDPGDLGLGSFQAEYRLSGTWSAGVQYAVADIEGLDTSIAAVYAIREAGPLVVGASVGDADDIDETVVGAFASYNSTETHTIGVEYLDLGTFDITALYSYHTVGQFEFSGSYVDLGTSDGMMLRGVFDVSPRVALTGGYAAFDLDSGGGVDVFGVGARYAVTEALNLGISYGQISFDGFSDETDVIFFGAEYEMGRRQSARSRLADVLHDTLLGLSGAFGV